MDYATPLAGRGKVHVQLVHALGALAWLNIGGHEGKYKKGQKQGCRKEDERLSAYSKGDIGVGA